jgi:prepilin-type N-terminal cleavage/methylation domain-containing protein
LANASIQPIKLRTANYKPRATNAANRAALSSQVCCAETERNRAVRHSSSGFTLIELILVMALIIIAVSVVTPNLRDFFRGRTVKYEASQILSLTHEGQSRAVSGGVPMVLWFDANNNKYGLEEEPGYVDKDPNAVEFELDKNLKIEVPDYDASTASLNGPSADTQRQGLPQITFLSDGSVADGSPRTVRLTDSEGPTVTLTQSSRNRNQYEISTAQQ